MDGLVVFASLRLCASPPITCFHGPTQVQISNDISIGSAVFAQLTAESRYTLQRGRPFPPLKLSPPTGNLDLRLMVSSAHQNPQPKRHLDQFSRFGTTHLRMSLYFTMGRTFLPQIAHSREGIWTPSNTWILMPTQVVNPNGISIGSAVFTGSLQ